MEPQHPLRKQHRDQTTSVAHTKSLVPHDNTIVAGAGRVCVYAGVHSGGVGHLGFL